MTEGQTGQRANGQGVAATFRSPADRGTRRWEWRRRRNRLPADRYVGNNIYHVTIVTEGREAVFSSAGAFDACREALENAAQAEGFELLAYVFMPDNLHLLAQGQEASNLAAFVKRFKQKTGFEFRRLGGRMLWQKSFHDHILRSDEDVSAVSLYIAANPVRAGIVMDWETYPYRGGTVLRAAAGDLQVAATSTPEPNSGKVLRAAAGDLKVAATSTSHVGDGL